MGCKGDTPGSCCYRPHHSRYGHRVVAINTAGLVVAFGCCGWSALHSFWISVSLFHAGVMPGFASGVLLGCVASVLWLVLFGVPVCCCTTAQGYRTTGALQAAVLVMNLAAVAAVASDHGSVTGEIDDDAVRRDVSVLVSGVYVWLLLPLVCAVPSMYCLHRARQEGEWTETQHKLPEPVAAALSAMIPEAREMLAAQIEYAKATRNQMELTETTSNTVLTTELKESPGENAV